MRQALSALTRCAIRNREYPSTLPVWQNSVLEYRILVESALEEEEENEILFLYQLC